MNESFGQIFKRLRIASGQTLRSFCAANDYDPGNISKIERGRMLPPSSRKLVEGYAKSLGVKRGSQDYQSLIDSAAAECGRVPDDLMGDRELVDKLPVLFRALRDSKPHTDGLDELIDKIRRA